MQWFKHSTESLLDHKVKKLLIRHGIKGYGVFFAVLEMVAARVNPQNQDYALPADTDYEVLASEWGLEVEELREIVKSCLQLGLLEVQAGRIAAPKLARRLDEYMSKANRRVVKNKDKEVEELTNWHLKQVREALGTMIGEPDMDQWYLSLLYILQAGVSFEEVRETIDFALNDSFWRDKVYNGDRLKRNYDKIRLQMDTGQKEPSREDVINKIMGGNS